MRIGCGADHVAQEAVRLAEVDDDGGVGDPDAQHEAVAEHGEVGEHLADFDAALVRRADDPLGPLPGDLGGKRQGVGPEQLGRLGRAREREIGGRRRAGADGQADPGVRSFGGLVDAAEHRLAAGADRAGRGRRARPARRPSTRSPDRRGVDRTSSSSCVRRSARPAEARAGGWDRDPSRRRRGRSRPRRPRWGPAPRVQARRRRCHGPRGRRSRGTAERSRRTTATPGERRRRSPTGRRRRSRRGTRRRGPSRRRGLRR